MIMKILTELKQFWDIRKLNASNIILIWIINEVVSLKPQYNYHKMAKNLK